MHPVPPGEPRLPARDVRKAEDERTAGAQPSRDRAKLRERIGEVLENMEHDHQIERRRGPHRAEVPNEDRDTRGRARG